ncbi:MAG: amino acid permease [Bacteroidales bacterium]|nr:amino acid permease [Bacteroidales bacterium]
MKNASLSSQKKGLGSAPVYFTAISSILGAILFLRMGYATGMLGFYGVLAIILLGHMITIPTALAISELATNTRVEGGGEYFIISRSFGLKIGSTIGITLFLSQTISIAFYTIAFAEAFQPLFEWCAYRFDLELPRQVISVPTLLILAYVMLKKGTGSSLRLMYIVNGILLVSLLLFFAGGPLASGMDPSRMTNPNFGFFNGSQFFLIFAICFPAFTGMTAGVGLSGDLRNPGKSIPIGTMVATLTGLAIYILVAWKLTVSASLADLVSDQLIISKIAIFGSLVIPIGLAASTSSSIIGSMMVAPRTLQAIACDKTFPFRKLNFFLGRGKGENKEPFNASLLSYAIALIFITLGDVNTVAEIISMFFLITYGSLCLISFLNHFGSPPSYRPRFKSKWYISLAGFILSVWVMFMINPLYTVLAYITIIIIYIVIEHFNKDKKGLVNIFKGALFQLNRKLQVYMQKHQSTMDKEEWRPAAVCISGHSLERDKVLELMKWISYQHGFGTYFHFIEGLYNKETHEKAQELLSTLIENQKDNDNSLYIDTMISPSYTSAIAQVIQTPSISGMENNMVVFEYETRYSKELSRILENVNLVKAGDFDVCIFAGSDHLLHNKNGIHVWIIDPEDKNTNFMILLGYIMLAHPNWRKSNIKIFITSSKADSKEERHDIQERIATGRLPFTLSNIEVVLLTDETCVHAAVLERSANAALTIIGFSDEVINNENVKFFHDYKEMGDVLFVNASQGKEIS